MALKCAINLSPIICPWQVSNNKNIFSYKQWFEVLNSFMPSRACHKSDMHLVQLSQQIKWPLRYLFQRSFYTSQLPLTVTSEKSHLRTLQQVSEMSSNDITMTALCHFFCSSYYLNQNWPLKWKFHKSHKHVWKFIFILQPWITFFMLIFFPSLFIHNVSVN